MEAIKMDVLIDEEGIECLYVDGRAWEATGEETVYVTDLVGAAGGSPILLTHRCVVRGDFGWPQRLEDALANHARNIAPATVS